MTEYNVKLLGGVAKFTLERTADDRVRLIGRLVYPLGISLSFDADVRLGVGVEDDSGALAMVMRFLQSRGEL